MAEQNGGISAERPSPAPVNALQAALVVAELVIATIVFSALTLIFTPFTRNAHQFSRLWAASWLYFFGIRVVVGGLENLDKNRRYIFAANHQSALDIPLLVHALPCRISFISKKSIFFIPIVGWAMWAVGHVSIDRSNARNARRSIIRAVKKLHDTNMNLIVFPEGTRSPDGTIGEFKRGSFSLAVESGLEIVPVCIHDSFGLLPKKSMRWRRGTVRISVGKPVDVAASGRAKKSELARTTRDAVTAMFQQ